MEIGTVLSIAALNVATMLAFYLLTNSNVNSRINGLEKQFNQRRSYAVESK